MKNGSLPRAFRETEFKQMDTLLYRKEKGEKRARILSFSYSFFFFAAAVVCKQMVLLYLRVIVLD